MCQQCEELVQKYYPALSRKDHFELLMGATCFPFGGPDLIEAQLVELLAYTDGTLHGALAYADHELTLDMWTYRHWEDQSPLAELEVGMGI